MSLLVDPRGAMQRSITTVVLTLAVLVVISCAHGPAPQAADPKRFEFVRAAIIAPEHEHQVVEILRRAGIQSFCEGSVAYAVMVPRGTEVRAQALLREEAAGGNWIWFP